MEHICIKTVERLLTGHNSSNEKIISGYNYYPRIASVNSNKILTFSNMHETKDYFASMMKDILSSGYPNDYVLMQVRDKYGTYRWEPNFRFRDDKGKVYPDLRIKDTRNNKYVDFSIIPFASFEEAGYTATEVSDFSGENKGWEINIGCDLVKDIIKLASLFVSKSSILPFDKNGMPKPETLEDKEIRDPWPDAYDTPVLIIGGDINQIREKVSSFIPAKIIRLEKDNKELSFIINSNFEKLKRIKEYDSLIELGFKEEDCLANLPFILQYVDP
jgi:hypothetical protein